MAHTAAVSSMVEELIKVTTKTSSGPQFERYKGLALREFATPQSGRTDQYLVNSRLEGLEEKARILNNDPLADVLHARLAELLPRSDTWIPEILTLLLQLSDRPVQNTKLEDLVLLKKDPTAAPLTWADIVADDPLDDQEGLWKNVDFSADAFDEDESVEVDEADESEQTPSSNLLNSESIEVTLDSLLVPENTSRLHEIEDVQFWQKKSAVSDGDHQPKLLLTELQVIREVIFMLLGLPTSIFTTDAMSCIVVNSDLAVRQLSQRALADLLQGFTIIGDKLAAIRQWSRRRTEVPLEQTFQAALVSRLVDIDSTFHKIQARIHRPQAQRTPSLMQLYHEVSHNSRFILQICEIINDVKLKPKPQLPFGILERCFDGTCVNQSMGDAEEYEYMAKLFFDCFQTYLRPIRYWMESGQLNRHDRIMFIRKSEEDVPLDSLWQKQFYLLQNDTAQLHAPRFLHLAAKKIFNTGKSVAFLRQLRYEVDQVGVLPHTKSEMKLEEVCRELDVGMLSPFTELFDMAFDSWIDSRYHLSSSVLRGQLETEYGLQRSLDALQFVYFCRNGSVSSNISLIIFEKIDRGNQRWNDSFILTELFQEAFGCLACVDIESLEVRSNEPSRKAGRSMSVLEDLRVFYTLSWPIANIIRLESMKTYQRVFIFITQIQRAQYLLQRQKLSRNASTSDKEPVLLIYRLHHQLLWFTSTIQSYTTDVVLSATNADMLVRMRSAEDVDSMIEVHDKYISQLQDRCFLTKQHSPIRQATVSLLDLTVLFSDVQASYSRQPSLERHETLEAYSQHRKGAPEASQDDDDSDDNAGKAEVCPISNTDLPDVDKLRSMCDTFGKLHGFVTAAVQGVSKANDAACWEILANNLAAGLEK
jgi:gamma-tubulin complex component 5